MFAPYLGAKEYKAKARICKCLKGHSKAHKGTGGKRDVGHKKEHFTGQKGTSIPRNITLKGRKGELRLRAQRRTLENTDRNTLGRKREQVHHKT